MDVSRQAVMDAINELAGTNGSRQFQSRLVRKALQVDASDRLSSTMIHNIMKTMEREGVIEEVPGERKRNKFFRLVRRPEGNPVKSDDSAEVEEIATRLSAPDRLTRIEQSLRSIEQRVTGIEAALRELLSIWK